MKSKLLTLFFLLTISIQIFPVIEMAKYMNRITAQKDFYEDFSETSDDSVEKESGFDKIGFSIHPPIQTAIIFTTNQAHILQISIQTDHQYFPNIPTPPPLFS